jgi:hypothetical protein
MTAVPFNPFVTYTDNSGNPLVGGKIYTYAAGTTTPQASYTDATGTTPATNPIILDSNGRSPYGAIWGSGSYKFVLADSTGATIQTDDAISAVFGSGDMTKAIYDAANIAQQLVGTSATQTLTNKNLSFNCTLDTLVTGVTQTAGDNSTKIATTAYVDNQGASAWVAYTPTFTGFGTVSGVAFYSRRCGRNLEIRGQFTSGTSTATEARITVGYNGTNSPAGLVADTAVVTSAPRFVGTGTQSIASANFLTILAESGIGYVTIGVQSASRAGLTKVNGDVVAASGNSVAIMASIPMQGW